MMEDLFREKINKAAALISESRRIAVFTGAGISTDSGIPDFRSENYGLWKNVDPMAVASIYGFKRDPQAFFDWVRPLTEVTLGASPNPSHYALADLERLGFQTTIITQNIDMLHTRAGNSCIYELHGHMRTGTCINCFKQYDGEALMHQFLEDNQVPKCEDCGGTIKPDVILFGEQLPIRQLQGAQEAARQCDLMLIVGSSLEVAPASDIPIIAHRKGAKLIVVNLDPTPADRYSDVVFHDRAVTILPEIIRTLENLV